MPSSLPSTLGALKAAGYRSRSVREELRSNLIRKLSEGDPLFPGIRGYEDTVIPQILNALLAQQDFILLGLRGQAKSRILRGLVGFLDPEIPALAGSEVNDDPLRPISREGRLLVEAAGDETPIRWLSRDERYIEKLATPDVTIADLIGDVDPIKAARGGHLLSDELTIHYGLLPRANRGIFALNELPDLSGKIQVGLFNILQEGDIQIRGYPVRLLLDLFLVFSANPEDYTARGKIITPLKDRIGAEIRTHYPDSLETGVEITAQEAWTDRGSVPIEIPDFVSETIERVAFLAREDRRIDQRSGVSQRMPITVLEGAVSNAERRAIRLREVRAVPRIGDIYSALPMITGKMELEYDGEIQGAEKIAWDLVAAAAHETFEARAGGAQVEEIVAYFESGAALQLSDSAGAEACVRGFQSVPGLLTLVTATGLAPLSANDGVRAAACELVLEALVAEKRISRNEGGYSRARHANHGKKGFGEGGTDFSPFGN
jgi:magnesium chelatase subunit I